MGGAWSNAAVRASLDLLCFALLGVAVALVFGGASEAGFWTSDGWFHVLVAEGLISGRPEAWRIPFAGDGPAEALRLTPYLFFVGDFLIGGAAADSYYRTNHLLLVGLVCSVFGLQRTFGVPRRVALPASALLLGFAPSVQLAYWVPSRDDGVAVFFAMLFLVLWRPLSRKAWGSFVLLGLFGLASFAKPPTAIQLLPVIALLVRYGEVGSIMPLAVVWRRLRPFVMLTLVWAVCLGVFIVGRLEPDGAEVQLGIEAVSRRLAQSFLPFYGMQGRLVSNEVVALVAGFPLVLAGLWTLRTDSSMNAGSVGSRTSADGRAVLLLGWGLVAASVLPVLPWLLTTGLDGRDQSRYLLLASCAIPLILSGSVMQVWRTRASTAVRAATVLLALVTLVGLLSSGLSYAQQTLQRQESSASDLVEKLVPAAEQLGSGGALFIGVRHPDWGVNSLLQSPLLHRLLPEGTEVSLFVQGARQSWSPPAGGVDYGKLSRDEDSGREVALDLRSLKAEDVLLWQVPTGDELRWELTRGPVRRSCGSSTLQVKEERSMVVRRDLSEHQLSRDLRRGLVRFEKMDSLLSLRAACRLRVQGRRSRPSPASDEVGDQLFFPEGFALATFGGASEALVLEHLPSGGFEIFLPNVASPPEVDVSLGFVPADRPGTFVLEGVELSGSL